MKEKEKKERKIKNKIKKKKKRIEEKDPLLDYSCGCKGFVNFTFWVWIFQS